MCLILTGSDQFSFAPETHYLGLRVCTTYAVRHENLLFLSSTVRDSTVSFITHFIVVVEILGLVSALFLKLILIIK